MESELRVYRKFSLIIPTWGCHYLRFHVVSFTANPFRHIRHFHVSDIFSELFGSFSRVNIPDGMDQGFAKRSCQESPCFGFSPLDKLCFPTINERIKLILQKSNELLFSFSLPCLRDMVTKQQSNHHFSIELCRVDGNCKMEESLGSNYVTSEKKHQYLLPFFHSLKGW